MVAKKHSTAPLAGVGEAAAFKDYPGAKGGAGVWQTIINNIPPHDCYVEAFVGSGVVFRNLRRAKSSIVIDRDPSVISLWDQFAASARLSQFLAVTDNAVEWLWRQSKTLKPENARRAVIYCDPPYLTAANGEARSRCYYAHEFLNERQHAGLLAVLIALAGVGARCLISGYRSALYDGTLKHWRRVDYRTTTRGGPVIESLWCSFPEPLELHDSRYLGRNFREREKLRRQQRRWQARLTAMPPLQRAALLNAVRQLATPEMERTAASLIES